MAVVTKVVDLARPKNKVRAESVESYVPYQPSCWVGEQVYLMNVIGGVLFVRDQQVEVVTNPRGRWSGMIFDDCVIADCGVSLLFHSGKIDESEVA